MDLHFAKAGYIGFRRTSVKASEEEDQIITKQKSLLHSVM